MYKIATAFELAWSYGYPRLMSSYEWGSTDWQGPPSDGNGNTNNVACFDGQWYCEYKWRQITNMVKFHNAAVGTAVLVSNNDLCGYIAAGIEDFVFSPNFIKPIASFCNISYLIIIYGNYVKIVIVLV